jgi:DNA-3-methyladenine glycosylase
MFGPPGHAYVYFTYGAHMMLNFVCAPEGIGEAVLIRAIEPIAGIEIMRRNRGNRSDIIGLTNGPGKLAQALQISIKNENGIDITRPNSPVCVISRDRGGIEIVESRRVGISSGVERPWRYYIKNNPYVSRR